MSTPKPALAIAQVVLIFPAVLFMGALAVRMLRPLQSEPAHTAQRIVMWYAGRMWTLWVLLIAFPLTVLLAGSATLLGNRRGGAHLATMQQPLGSVPGNRAMQWITAETLAAGVVLVIVIMHMVTN